jgi:putative transposase
VVTMCRVLGVSRAGFYAWLEHVPSARARADVGFLAAIRRVHAANYEAYGVRRTWRTLHGEGVHCGKHRIARLRREAGLATRRRRRFRITVEHRHTVPPAPDLLQRQFEQAKPNQAWVGDMTFIRTRAGWLHLAILLDLYSRRVVGWGMGARPTEQVALDALNMALRQRCPAPGLIHHTDQGVLYRSTHYRARLADHRVLPSMGSKGNPHDNAVSESFFSSLKNELVHHCDFKTHQEARSAIFQYIETFYNPRRLHQSLGYRTPVAFESETLDS